MEKQILEESKKAENWALYKQVYIRFKLYFPFEKFKVKDLEEINFYIHMRSWVSLLGVVLY